MFLTHFNTLDFTHYHFLNNNKKLGGIMLRCSICDYTQEEGSDYADLAPGRFKLHPTPNGDFLCDECLNSVEENLFDLEDNDEE